MLRVFTGDDDDDLLPGDAFARGPVGIVAACELHPTDAVRCAIVRFVFPCSQGAVGVADDRYAVAPWVVEIRHSCRPTTRVEFTGDAIRVIPLATLNPGTPITRFFPATEWMVHPGGPCQCGEPGCIQALYGGVSLTLNQFRGLPVADHVARKIAFRAAHGLP